MHNNPLNLRSKGNPYLLKTPIIALSNTDLITPPSRMAQYTMPSLLPRLRTYLNNNRWLDHHSCLHLRSCSYQSYGLWCIFGLEPNYIESIPKDIRTPHILMIVYSIHFIGQYQNNHGYGAIYQESARSGYSQEISERPIL